MYTIVDGYAYCIKGNIGYKISIDAFGNTNLSSEDTIEITNQPVYTYDEMNRKLNLKKQVDELRKELLNENTDLSIFSEFYDNVRKGFKDKKSFEKVVIKTVDKILNPPAPVHTHNWITKEKTIKQGDVCWEEWEECSECGEKRNVQSHGHSFGEPVDDGDGGLIYECSRCHLQQSAEEPSHTHDWKPKEEPVGSEDVCYRTWEECSECHEKRNIVDHPHNMKETVDDFGYPIWRCTECSYEK